MDVTVNEYIQLTSTSWNCIYQPLIFDIIKDKITGCNGLGLYSVLFSDTRPF